LIGLIVVVPEYTEEGDELAEVWQAGGPCAWTVLLSGAAWSLAVGVLRIIDVDGDLPVPWTPDGLRTPGIEAHHGIRYLWPIGPIGACVRPLTRIAAALTERAQAGQGIPVPFALPADEQPPQFPVLSKSFTVAGLSGGAHFTDWTYVLAHAGDQLRDFRASRSAPEAR
jgi:hypothetical protein